MWYISSAILLGWSLGANDAANVFGTAVTSNIIRWRTAAILTAIFVIIGAIIRGQAGLETLGSLTDQTVSQAFITMLAAAISVGLMTKLKLPVSTSQAVVGAIIGGGLIGKGVDWSVLVKIVICWIGTPIGAALISLLLYNILGLIFRKLNPNFFEFDSIIRKLLVVFGMYSAYALGANNVANVTGVFFQTKLITGFEACLIGALSIAFGVVTYSKNVMKTVGRGIIPIDSFSALVTVLASAITVHIYAFVGVPVSSSQAIVGAVIGIAFIKGFESLNKRNVLYILYGWLCTPLISGILTVLLTFMSRIRITYS